MIMNTDFLETAAAALRDTADITLITQSGDYTFISVDNALFSANEYISIDGCGELDSDNVMIESINGSVLKLKLSGTISTFGTVTKKVPYFGLGTQRHIAEIRDKAKTSKAPFIFIPENRITFNPVKLQTNYGEITILNRFTIERMYVLTETNPNNSNDILRQTVDEMLVLANTFISEIYLQSNVTKVITGDYKKHLRFGAESDFGYSQLFLNEKLSGIELRDVVIDLSPEVTTCRNYLTEYIVFSFNTDDIPIFEFEALRVSSGSVVVNWGDGTITTISGSISNLTHTYSPGQNITLAITGNIRNIKELTVPNENLFSEYGIPKDIVANTGYIQWLQKYLNALFNYGENGIFVTGTNESYSVLIEAAKNPLDLSYVTAVIDSIDIGEYTLTENRVLRFQYVAGSLTFVIAALNLTGTVYIDYGDGSAPVAKTGNNSNITKVYGAVGTYEVLIYGDVDTITTINMQTMPVLIDIHQFINFSAIVSLNIRNSNAFGNYNHIYVSSCNFFNVLTTNVYGSIEIFRNSLTPNITIRTQDTNTTGDVNVIFSANILTVASANTYLTYTPAAALVRRDNMTLILSGNLTLTALMASYLLIDLNDSESINGNLNMSGCNGGSLKIADLTTEGQAARTSLLGKGWIITLNT